MAYTKNYYNNKGTSTLIKFSLNNELNIKIRITEIKGGIVPAILFDSKGAKLKVHFFPKFTDLTTSNNEHIITINTEVEQWTKTT